MSFLKRLLKAAHRHKWEVTHTNQWQHDTRQRCSCGLSREFQYPRPELPIGVAMKRKIRVVGMPWSRGLWVWSNRKVTPYDYFR